MEDHEDFVDKDKATDTSIREQTVINFIRVDECMEDHEDFVGLYEIDDLCAEILERLILRMFS